jgi:hypothetical protein
VAVQRVIQTFKDEPHMSIRRAANLNGMPSAATIRRILKEQHFRCTSITLPLLANQTRHWARLLSVRSMTKCSPQGSQSPNSHFVGQTHMVDGKNCCINLLTFLEVMLSYTAFYSSLFLFKTVIKLLNFAHLASIGFFNKFLSLLIDATHTRQNPILSCIQCRQNHYDRMNI